MTDIINSNCKKCYLELKNNISNIYYNKINLSRYVPYDEQEKLNKRGIYRKKIADKTFDYFYIKTNEKVDESDIKRIKTLKLPPAWENVWISDDKTTSIQAIGYDERGRKQYRYHTEHIDTAEKNKFVKLYYFIKAIPVLEKQMKKDLLLNPYNKDRVIVTMLMMIKQLYIRVGKEHYAKTNKSYGISSLKKTHVKANGESVINLNFKGKSNKRLTYTLKDTVIHKHIKLLLKLEGEKLFQYINDKNHVVRISDVDINNYIKKHMGPKFTAKDFRTYAGNLYFIKSLLHETKKRTPMKLSQIKKNISNAIKNTAYYLKNTKAVSKKSYIGHFAIELYQTNTDFFADNKDIDPNVVLLDILKLYKQKVLNIK